jgi:ABC-type glycerol-3-phosphate transport system permease component
MNGALSMITRRRRDRVILYVLLTVTALIWIFPLYSAMQRALAVNGFHNFVQIFTHPLDGIPIWRTYLNSFVIGAIHATIVVTASTMAGYAFSKLRFRGRDLYYYGTILFLAIPGTAILIPLYYVTRELHLFDNYLGVALPEAALTLPFGVLLMRNFGDNVPDVLIDAALIDRASHFQIFRKVFLPIARPAVINLTVLCFMWSLQDFLWPVIFFSKPSMTTAAQAVTTYQNSLTSSPQDTALYNASLVLLAVPAIALVLFGMRFITNGLTSGAVKD